VGRLFYAIAGAALLLLAFGLVNAEYYSDTDTSIPDGTGGVTLGVSVDVNTYYNGYGYGYYGGYGGYNDPYAPAYFYAHYPYTHYCTYSYFYGYYTCDGATAGYGATSYGAVNYATPYCDPFDPYYYQYCASPYSASPYTTYYPTYVVNPGTIVYAGGGVSFGSQGSPNQVQAKPCSDGTPNGVCSTDYPKYCFNGQLIDKATLCGCPAGQVQDPVNRNRCVVQTCSDGTSLNSCSSSKPSFCTSNAQLVERPDQCGCPANTRLEAGQCVALAQSCYLSTVSPRVVREGESATVSVQYNDVRSASGFAVCGDGSQAPLTCTPSVDGVSGVCTATCTYVSSSESPRLVSASVSGRTCSGSSTVNVIPARSMVGAALVKVTQCGSGNDLNGATVNIDGLTAVTNARGEATFSGLVPGMYNVAVSKSGFKPAATSLVVMQERSAISPVCLDSGPQCDIDVSLSGVRASGDLRGDLQFLVTNRGAAPNMVDLSYSLPVEFDAPGEISLAGGESQVVTVTPRTPEGFAGVGLASVSARSLNGACTRNVAFPLSLGNGVSLESLGAEKTGRPGEEVCFDLLARNRADRGADIRLTSHATPQLTIDLSNERFTLNSGQTKIVRACTTLPETASGEYNLDVHAASSVNDATAHLTIRTAGSVTSAVSTTCFAVNNSRTQFFDVAINNNGNAGSFTAQLVPSRGFNARLVQPNLFNFRNSTSRAVTVQVDPEAMQTSEARALLSIYAKDGGVKVFERELCFTQRDFDRFNAVSTLSPTRVRVEAGLTAHAFVHVKNTGNVLDFYEVSTASPFGEDETQRISLRSGEEKSVELAIHVPGDAEPGTYLMPVSVSTLRGQSRREVSFSTLAIDVFQPVPQTPLNLVKAGPAQVEFTAAQSLIKIILPLTNLDNAVRTIRASLENLPAGWTYTVSPAQVEMANGNTTNFVFVITAQNLEAKDYNVTAVFRDEFGREKSEVVQLPAKSGSWLSGFFVLGSSGQLLAVVVILLVLAGLYLLFRAWEMRKEIQREQGLRV